MGRMGLAKMLGVGRWVSLAIFFAVMFGAAPVAAQARDLSQPQPGSWTGTHVGATSGMALVALGVLLSTDETEPRVRFAYSWEQYTEQNFSPLTSRVSDHALIFGVSSPLWSTYLARDGHSWGNSVLIYGETVTASLLANSIVKKLVLRARPYTENGSDAARALEREAGADNYYSFYSGHTSLAFTSAVSGSYLVSATGTSRGFSVARWGASMALAGFTGYSRVQAGRHYPTDVLVGAIVGTGFGLAVPLLHQVKADITGAEVGTAVGGTLAGVGIALLMPNKVKKEVAGLRPQIHPVKEGAVLSFEGRFF